VIASAPPQARGFRHELLRYAGNQDFVDRAAPIVLHALEAGDPVLIAIDPVKLELLRDHLGSAARSVAWRDIRGIGANPARIIPVWRQFVARGGSAQRLLGFGEPIWAERAPAELAEAQHHERLLNLAFAGVPNFTLICPYDTDRLSPSVLDEGLRCHPIVVESGDEGINAEYDDGPEAIPASISHALLDPTDEPVELGVDAVGNTQMRSHIARLGLAAGLTAARADDLSVAIAAVAESMGRPGAQRLVRVWPDSGSLLAELRDLVAIEDPLAGREWPPPTGGPARGLWLANQLCDLVQVRRFGTGVLVRLHVAGGRRWT
jgi:hypothetical protein